MKIDFRQAWPEDSDQVVPLIYSSGPKTFNYVFAVDYPEQAMDFLRQAFAHPQGQFSHSEHRLILADGNIVGCASLASADNGMAHMLESVKQVLGYYGLIKGLGVLLRGLKAERIIAPPQPGEAYICNLAANPPGAGFGTRLIDHLIAIGQANNLAIASLDVADSNTHARALYLRLGFQAVLHRPAQRHYKWGLLEGHTYMRKEI